MEEEWSRHLEEEAMDYLNTLDFPQWGWLPADGCDICMIISDSLSRHIIKVWIKIFVVSAWGAFRTVLFQNKAWMRIPECELI